MTTVLERFPGEFSDLLTPRFRAPGLDGRRIVLMRNPFAPEVAAACVRLLDEHMAPRLKSMNRPIPPEAMSGMQENFRDLLPKSLRQKTVELNTRGTAGYCAAERINLVRMMKSRSLREFAERVIGRRLVLAGRQVICYGHGDYVSPHTDHHPEDADIRGGYVDVHIMFGNNAVAHHYLVYEKEGHLSQIASVAMPSGIAVYHLPFWHYTTPLAAKPGREPEARRWLLLSSYRFRKTPVHAAGKAG